MTSGEREPSPPQERVGDGCRSHAWWDDPQRCGDTVLPEATATFGSHEVIAGKPHAPWGTPFASGKNLSPKRKKEYALTTRKSQLHRVSMKKAMCTPESGAHMACPIEPAAKPAPASSRRLEEDHLG